MPGWCKMNGMEIRIEKWLLCSIYMGQDTDGKWYYFDIGGYMQTDYDTPDGFQVGPDGVWDGQAATGEYGQNPGPGGVANTSEQSSAENEASQADLTDETAGTLE